MRPVNHSQLTDDADQSSFALSGLPPSSCERPQDANALSVTVVFTTVPATLIALQRGGELAQQLGARIRILVPQVVPYPLPIDRPQSIRGSRLDIFGQSQLMVPSKRGLMCVCAEMLTMPLCRASPLDQWF